MGKHLRLLGALLLCSSLVLNGCGGGGGSTPGDSNLTAIKSGVAVDPYIVGAVFEEFDANDKLIQESAPSNANGRFEFNDYLHKNSKIKLKSGSGLHAGMPFSGNLARNIDITDGKLVVNPLTTLIAQGMTEAAVLEMLKTITGNTTFTAADLTADPMANLSDGDMTEKDKALLAANMAVNTAVEVLGGNIGNQNLTIVATVVATKLITQVLNSLESKSTGADLNTAAATGITITTYLKDTVVVNTDGTTDVESVTSLLTTDYINSISDLVANDPTKPVVIIDIDTKPVQVADMNALAQIYYNAGQAAYTEGSNTGSTATLMTAIDKFNAAAALTASITDAALKDKVLFFGAFAKVLQVAKPMSDGTANGLNNFGDILDAFGLAGAPAATDRSNINTLSIDVCTTESVNYGGSYTYTWQECEIAPLSDTSPTSGELQTFLGAKVGAGLKDAVTMLNQVSSTFGETVNDAGVAVEFDATDAKFISAVANGMLAQINLVQAYDVNVDLDNEQTLANSDTPRTPEQFLAANPNLGKLQDATRMAAVKTYSNAAIAALEAAVTALKAETDSNAGQANDFVAFDNTNCYWTNNSYVCDPTTYNDTTEFEATLAEAKKTINATTYNVMDNGPDGIAGTTDDVVAAKIDVSKFFAGVDLRSKIPTSFNKGASLDMPGLLPDPAFGGVLVQVDGQEPSILNTDEDKDGSPDFFDGKTYFMPGMLTDRTFQTWVNDGSGNWKEWRFTFDSDTVFSGTVSYWLQVAPYGQVTHDISGTYTTAKNVLTLNMSPAYGPITRIESSLQGGYSEGDSGFDFKTETFGTSGSLGTFYNWFSEVQQLVAI